MQKFTVYSVLILGLATSSMADDAAVPAGAEPEATADVEAKPEAKPVAPDTKPAENKADAQKVSKAEALKKAAEEDPDVAARLETPYPLDGEEWKEYPLGILEMEMAEAINMLLTRLPNLRLDPDYPPPHVSGFSLRGAAALHVRFD